MAQNVYDDPAFFEGYSQFPRSVGGLAAAPEWPALQSMLPPVTGSRILDLGCGFGAFSRWAAEAGAADVLAVDLSERMLDTARERNSGLHIRFQQSDLDSLDLAGQQFDLVFSSLALHYVADFDRLCRTVRAALASNGRFVFSVEHPIYAARAEPEWGVDGRGKRVFLLNDYLEEGERITNWVVPGVKKYHRVLSTMIRTLHGSGFRLDDVVEWGPSDALLAARPDFGEHRIRPMFLLIAAHVATD